MVVGTDLNTASKRPAAVSDHINFAFTVNVEELPEKMGKNHVTNNTTSVKCIRLVSLYEHDFLACYNKTDKYLNNIYYRSKDVKCKNLELKRKLCSMYDDIVAALHESGKSFDVQRKHKRKLINFGPWL